jgi:hypothetical protein
MTHWIRFGIVVVAALVVSRCDQGPSGPSKSVAGSWSATGCCMGSERYELSLTQQGDVIEGVVCLMVSGVLGVKDVTVSGRYPNVRFDLSGPGVIAGVEPSFIVRVFSGKFEADRDQIAGNLRDTPLRFNRIGTDGRCSGARPRP